MQGGVDLFNNVNKKSEDYSVLDLLFNFNDGGLIDEDFNQEDAEFADVYYDDKLPFSKKYGSYLQDYCSLDMPFLRVPKKKVIIIFISQVKMV
ncbi:DUF7832 domain-containing protein [Commensalibacter nepenthis]